MAGASRSNILVAAIGALSAVVIAAITTYGTIAVSSPEAKKVKDELATIAVSAQEAKDSVRSLWGAIAPLKQIELPIGTIVPSMLHPSLFAKEVGDPSVFDPEVSKWVLAGDSSKDISRSQYGQRLPTRYAPDLRGMFLRGMNEGRNDGKQDPDGREAGSYQPQSIEAHRHKIGTAGIWPRTWANGGSGEPKTAYKADGFTDPSGGKETRPKNVAVYFYIKIN